MPAADGGGARRDRGRRAAAGRRGGAGGFLNPLPCHDGRGAGAAPARPKALPRIALAGSPNSGKTTLFNALTGLRAKTGNYPGVTVDRREGTARTPAGPVRVIDLPGLYSLHPMSEDETVALRVLQGEVNGDGAPDALVIVADSTTLERSLPVIAEMLALGLPSCLALTMVDELKARGGGVDLFRLRQALGIPVVGVVGNRGIGIADLRALMGECRSWPGAKDLPPDHPDARFAWADGLLRRVGRRRPSESRLTRRLDAVLLHPAAGLAVFLLFIVAFFQAIFSWARPAMDLLSGLADGAAAGVLAAMAPGFAAELCAGVVRGVGAVAAFVPQIALLFAVIYLLEACGYMARAAFVVDRLMGWLGLEGRCFISLLSSYACAVPGILATRTIPSPRDRLATILAAPFATCSARLPVYALLIGAFIPPEPVLGPFTWQGLTLLGLYALGGASALLAAGLLKRHLLRGAALPFYLDLPPYRFPSPRAALFQVWLRVWGFLRRAGTIILLVTALISALLHLPRRDPPPGASPAQARAHVVEHSYAAAVGRALEPVFAPLGFDWRINVGLVGAQVAREVMVTTLAQVYACDQPQPDRSADLAQVLAAPDPAGGTPRLGRASALALLAYFVYALQCTSTVVVMRRETGSWKWPAIAFVAMTALGWLAGWITYRLAS